MPRITLPAPPAKSDDGAAEVWRKSVRKALLGWRAAMDPSVHHTFSVSIRKAIAEILIDRPKATIGFYWPIQNEIDLRPVIETHIECGGRAALPVVPGKDQPMVFHDWCADTKMVAGFAKIPEPVDASVVPVHVMIAPLVGFDGRGYRLGYGGGFFDRTLAVMPVAPLVVGVGFEATRVDDIFPHQYDIPVDIIVTEAGIRPMTDKAVGAGDHNKGASPPCYLSS